MVYLVEKADMGNWKLLVKAESEDSVNLLLNLTDDDKILKTFTDSEIHVLCTSRFAVVS